MKSEAPITGVPEGWQLVPKEPTREMCNAYSIAEHEGWLLPDQYDDPLPPFEAAWKAALAAAPPGSASQPTGTGETAVPEGWQIVPKEPTREMLEALSHEAGVNGYHSRGGPLCWRALLAAAPQPPRAAPSPLPDEVRVKLDELRALSEKATPGKWFLDYEEVGDEDSGVTAYEPYGVCAPNPGGAVVDMPSARNAAFISASVNFVRDLLSPTGQERVQRSDDPSAGAVPIPDCGHRGDDPCVGYVHALARANAAEHKLAEVEAERDRWKAVALDEQPTLGKHIGSLLDDLTEARQQLARAMAALTPFAQIAESDLFEGFRDDTWLHIIEASHPFEGDFKFADLRRARDTYVVLSPSSIDATREEKRDAE